MQKCLLFFKFPAREQVWVLLIFFLSGVIRMALLSLPFRWLAPYIGQHYAKIQLSTLVTPNQLQQAWRIGKIIKLVTKYTPWESKCLVQAICAKCLLHYYDTPYVIYLGVTKAVNEGNALKAHAWTKVGPYAITGQAGHRSFVIISTFIAPTCLPSGQQ